MSQHSDSGSRQASVRSSTARALLDLGFLPQGEPADDLAASPQKAGDFIGRYCLVARLGEGGFGMVWQADQTEPIHRELALKVIKPGLDSREIIARFEAERQALALMEHPNIAAVLDAGTTADGRPFFAMELVKGEPITTYCDQHRLGIEERLALFIPVCRAVQHAHQKSILHRDLKPSNILVATVDGQPVPKVIDFGIAKALTGNESPGPASMVHTQVGMVIGTPRYMSPEQAGSRPDVDTRSDIYALGVVLCELLTGQSPHPSQPTEFLDALRWIRESDPVKPSTLVQSATPATEEAARQRGVDSRRLARKLKGDLDWITLKALEKDRTLRYETATALSLDLERHLAAEPVSAVAPTWGYQFGKFARRRRGALIAASLIVAALIAGTVVSLWQAAQARQSRREAERRYEQARDAVDKYLVQVTDNPKLNQSNFADLQRELLETAMPFFEDLSRDGGEDPQLRSDRASALSGLAKLAQLTGQMDKAESTCRQAVTEFSKLAAQLPQQPDRQMLLGLQHNRLALLLQARGRLDEALAEHSQAIQAVEAVAQRFPTVTRYQYCLGQVLNDQATTFECLHRDQDVIHAVDRASAIGQKLINQNPKVANFWLLLAATANIQASPLHREQRYLDEVTVLKKTVEFFETAARLAPSSRDSRESEAVNRGRLGAALCLAHHQTEAEPILRQSVAQLQVLADEFPLFIICQHNLLTYQKELARNLFAQKKDAEADAVLEQVRAAQERLVRDFPAETTYSVDLAATLATMGRRASSLKDWTKAEEYLKRAVALHSEESSLVSLASAEMHLGHHSETTKHVQEFVGLAPNDWEKTEFAAETLAATLPQIQADNKLDAETRQKQIEDGAAQAVDLLKQAIAQGFTGMSYFNTLGCSRLLRSRPDYQALLQWPVAPPPHSPRKFKFDYHFEDPGPRQWVREGLTWTETQPSGTKNIYIVIGPTTVEGMQGSRLNRVGPQFLTLFVPDLDTEKSMRVWMRKPDGNWAHFSPMTDVE